MDTEDRQRSNTNKIVASEEEKQNEDQNKYENHT